MVSVWRTVPFERKATLETVPLAPEAVRSVAVAVRVRFPPGERMVSLAGLVRTTCGNVATQSDANNQTPSGLANTTLAPRKRIILRRSMEKASDMMHTRG